MKLGKSGKPRKRMARIAAAVGVSATALLGVAAVTATPALAGSNGQQIYFSYDGPPNGYAYLVGENQDGTVVYSPSISLSSSGYGQLNNWWWQGQVYVIMFNSSGSFVRDYGCNVPQSQWWSNWTAC
jgi:hypothetical protein